MASGFRFTVLCDVEGTHCIIRQLVVNFLIDVIIEVMQLCKNVSILTIGTIHLNRPAYPREGL